MDAALQNTLLSQKNERMHLEIEREMDRASKAEAEVVRLKKEIEGHCSAMQHVQHNERMRVSQEYHEKRH